MRMTAGEAARLLGARLEGDPEAMLTGAAEDSRLLRPGDLFVALPGERTDGHRFVGHALAVASAVLVRENEPLPPPPAGRALLRVGDPLAAVEALAAHERRSRPWRVAGVTGSVGKTTTKDLLAQLLGARFTTGATRGNRNAIVSLPSEILSQPPEVEVFVAEMGMSHPGEMDRKARVVVPDLMLYTRIAAAHMEFFPDLAAVARAKAEAIPHVARGGTLVLNAEDPWQVPFPSLRPDLATVRYGSSEGEVRLERLEARGLEGSRITLRAGQRRADLELRLPGKHLAEDLLAAAAAAWALGVPVERMAEVVPRLEPAPRRGRVHRLPAGITLVDDSYNASPAAVAALLELLAESAGRRVAVLGEMLELGQAAEAAHREAGAAAARAAEVLVAVGGPNARLLAEAARGTGLSAAAVHHAEDAASALELLRSLLEPGDVVLVKGSRGVALDLVVDGLTGGGEAA